MSTSASAEQRLRASVGVPLDASVVQFRAAYDLAMHRATRSGDHQRALALSQAYDRLPPLTREQMYPSSRAAHSRAVASSTARHRRPGSARRAARPGRRRAVWTRLLVYGVVAPAAIAVGTAVGVHLHRQSGVDDQVGPQLPAPIAVPTARTYVGAGASVVVPSSAPTGGNGLVSLMCQPADTSRPGYLMTAPRGAIVTCTNGAVPAVIG